MSTVHLETEIVATHYDAASRQCFYTIERDGRQWTVGIPEDDLNRHKANKAARRMHLAQTLSVAMQGKADGEI